MMAKSIFLLRGFLIVLNTIRSVGLCCDLNAKSSPWMLKVVLNFLPPSNFLKLFMWMVKASLTYYPSQWVESDFKLQDFQLEEVDLDNFVTLLR